MNADIKHVPAKSPKSGQGWVIIFYHCGHDLILYLSLEISSVM